jgi:hypothetical protein
VSICGILSLLVFIIKADCVLCAVQYETEEAVDSLLFKTGNCFFGLGFYLTETQSVSLTETQCVSTVKFGHDQV